MKTRRDSQSARNCAKYRARVYMLCAPWFLPSLSRVNRLNRVKRVNMVNRMQPPIMSFASYCYHTDRLRSLNVCVLPKCEEMTSENYEIIKLDSFSYSEAVSDFLMHNFLLDEPLNRASKMTIESFKPFVEKLLQRTLNVPFSFAVREKDSGKLVGCAMSSIWDKNEPENEASDPDVFSFDSGENKAVVAVGRVLSRLHERFFVLRPDLDKVLHLEILSVAKEHQRKGLASKLMSVTENVENLKTFQISTIASEISSIANQCLMRKRGYTTISEVLLNEEVGAGGEQLIQTDDGTDRVTLVLKEF